MYVVFAAVVRMSSSSSSVHFRLQQYFKHRLLYRPHHPAVFDSHKVHHIVMQQPSPLETREPSLESPNSAVLGLAGDRSDDGGPANAGPATTQRQSAKFRSLNFQPANDHFADFKSASSQPYNIRFEPAKVQPFEAVGRPRVSMQSVKQWLVREVPANTRLALR